jgi:hypothetical protein
MSRDPIKTDHSYFEEKVKLRLDNLPDVNPVKVLDMFSGNGLIWEEIEERTGREILVLRIDRQRGKRGTYLVGDNLKFNLDYGAFDVVDVDAYGVPFRQLERIFGQTPKPKRVFITFIQSQWGVLPRKMLNAIGYTDEMIKKVPTLFNRDGQGKFLRYLALRGVEKVKIAYTQDRRKNYLSV